MKRSTFLSLLPLAACNYVDQDPLVLGPIKIGQPMSETLAVLGPGTRATSESKQLQSDTCRVYYTHSGLVIADFRNGFLRYFLAEQRRIDEVLPFHFAFLDIDRRESIAIAKIEVANLDWLGYPVFSHVDRPTPRGWIRPYSTRGTTFFCPDLAATVTLKPQMFSPDLYLEMERN